MAFMQCLLPCGLNPKFFGSIRILRTILQDFFDNLCQVFETASTLTRSTKDNFSNIVRRQSSFRVSIGEQSSVLLSFMEFGSFLLFILSSSLVSFRKLLKKKEINFSANFFVIKSMISFRVQNLTVEKALGPT